MRPFRWIRRQLDRPIAGHEHRIATVGGLLLLIAAAALVLTSPTGPATVTRPRWHRNLTIQASVPASRWTPRTAADSRAASEAFFGSYLAFLYGQAPARNVDDATASFVRSLQRVQQRVPPGISELHPRVVSLKVSPQGASRAIAIALVSDAEVVRYSVRVVLVHSAGKWLASGLEGTP